MSPLEAYMQNSVITASPLQQIILLYERAIVALKSAKENIQEGDISAKVENITKVSDIMRALDSALDFEQGGEIAKNLHLLYDFVQRSLFQVHAKNDLQLIDDLVEILQKLKEGWEGIESNH